MVESLDMQKGGGCSEKGSVFDWVVQDDGVLIFGRLFDGGSNGEPHSITGAKFSWFMMNSACWWKFASQMLSLHPQT